MERRDMSLRGVRDGGLFVDTVRRSAGVSRSLEANGGRGRLRLPLSRSWRGPDDNRRVKSVDGCRPPLRMTVSGKSKRAILRPGRPSTGPGPDGRFIAGRSVLRRKAAMERISSE
jgi:hypothetical protein